MSDDLRPQLLALLSAVEDLALRLDALEERLTRQTIIMPDAAPNE
jgi:hypothetical protein